MTSIKQNKNIETDPILSLQSEDRSKPSALRKVCCWGRDIVDWSQLPALFTLGGGTGAFVYGEIRQNRLASQISFAVSAFALSVLIIRLSFLKKGKQNEIKELKVSNKNLKVEIEILEAKVKELEKNKLGVSELEQSNQDLTIQNEKLKKDFIELKKSQKEALSKLSETQKGTQKKLDILAPLLKYNNVKNALKEAKDEERRKKNSSQDSNSSLSSFNFSELNTSSRTDNSMSNISSPAFSPISSPIITPADSPLESPRSE